MFSLSDQGPIGPTGATGYVNMLDYVYQPEIYINLHRWSPFLSHKTDDHISCSALKVLSAPLEQLEPPGMHVRATSRYRRRLPWSSAIHKLAKPALLSTAKLVVDHWLVADAGLRVTKVTKVRPESWERSLSAAAASQLSPLAKRAPYCRPSAQLVHRLSSAS